MKSGAKSWSEITREDWQFVEAEKKCIYCGGESDLHKEHIVPKCGVFGGGRRIGGRCS